MLIALAMVCLGSAALLFFLLLSSGSSDDAAAHSDATDAGDAEFVGNKIRILSAPQLIDTLDLQPTLQQINRNLGLSDQNWQTDALPFLHNYIAFVQRLPASESHHHAGDGGLVKHTLDVAALALAASTAQSWPPGAKTEDIAGKTAVWRYGIMTAAILHDVGKTITGFDIDLYQQHKDNDGVRWLPDAGNMADTGCRYYHVSFPAPEDRADYRKHAEIAWTFFQALVPVHVRQWIASVDHGLMLELRSYLSGEKDKSPLHKLITQADMASVARDLRHGSRQRFATAQSTPLVEIIMETLRTMLAERGRYFSIATTAGGDLFRVGEDVYIVSKNLPDYIRAYLRAKKSDVSFPDNQRIFDTLFEYGIVKPHPQTPFKAISRVDVSFTRTDGEAKSQHFTVLHFAAATLYPDGQYPTEFQGSLSLSYQVQQPEADAADSPKNTATDTVTIPQETKTESKQETTDTVNSPPPAILTDSPGDINELLEMAGLVEDISDEHSPSEETDPAPILAEAVKTVSEAETAPETQTTHKPTRLNNKLTHKKIDIAATAKSTTNGSSQNLPPEETAQRAVAEIQAERAQLPTTAPRPIAIAPNTLESVRQEQEIDSLKPEQHDDNTAQELITRLANESRDRGWQFVRWLSEGIANNSIPYNQTGTQVHFVKEGMLLVTPEIFKLFTGKRLNKYDSFCPTLLTQKGFELLSLHERSGNSGLFAAVATGAPEVRLFHCYLIPEQNLRHFFQTGSRPQNNTKIALGDSKK